MRTARVSQPYLLLQLPLDVSSVGSSSEQVRAVSNPEHQMSVTRGRGGPNVPCLGRGVRCVPMTHAQGTLYSEVQCIVGNGHCEKTNRQTRLKHYLSVTLLADGKHVQDGPIQLHGKPVTVRSKFHLGRRLHQCKFELKLENSDKLIWKTSESI